MPRLCMTPPDGWRGLKCDCDRRPHICPACQAWAANGFQTDEEATAAKITAEQQAKEQKKAAKLNQLMELLTKGAVEQLDFVSGGRPLRKFHIIIRPDLALFWCWSKWDNDLSKVARYSTRAMAAAAKKELEEELARCNDFPADFLIIRPIHQVFPKKPPVSDL